MARTQLPTTLIADETIVRADLNVSTAGSAVIRKIVQGTGITISSSGIDTGTGDVTISLNTSSVVTSFNNRTGAVSLNSSDITTALGFNPISSAVISLNGVTTASQSLVTGNAGTDFNISSSGSTHTFNLPSASATARGLITTGDQTFAGAKTFSSNLTLSALAGTGTRMVVANATGVLSTQAIPSGGGSPTTVTVSLPTSATTTIYTSSTAFFLGFLKLEYYAVDAINTDRQESGILICTFNSGAAPQAMAQTTGVVTLGGPPAINFTANVISGTTLTVTAMNTAMNDFVISFKPYEI
jgi:hypothetical protein